MTFSHFGKSSPNSFIMLLAHKKISGLQNLAGLCNRRLPNLEVDQVVQQVNSPANRIICLERMKFNSGYVIQIKIINHFFYPLSKSVFKVNEACQVFPSHEFGRGNVAALIGFQCPLP